MRDNKELAHLIARLMAAIETPGDLTKAEVNDLLEDAHIIYRGLMGEDLDPRAGVMATVHDDHYRLEVTFDAAPWLRDATDDDLRCLMDDWGPGENTDAIAQELEESYKDLRRFFWFLGVVEDGFGVEVNEKQALAWIKVHRPHLLEDTDGSQED